MGSGGSGCEVVVTQRMRGCGGVVVVVELGGGDMAIIVVVVAVVVSDGGWGEGVSTYLTFSPSPSPPSPPLLWSLSVRTWWSIDPDMIINYITVTATQERWIFPLQIRRVLIKYTLAAYSG